MSFSVTFVNQAQIGSGYMFHLKERLKAGGWIVYRSSTGFTGTVGTTDLLINSGTIGRDSWFCIHSPTGTLPRRDFLFKQSSFDGSTGVWMMQYTSDGVGFVSGVAADITPPSASLNGGRIYLFSNTGLPSAFCPNDNTFKAAYIIGDVNEGFSFFAPFIEATSASVLGGFGMDYCTATSSFDSDPVVNIVLRNSVPFRSAGAFFAGAQDIVGNNSNPFCAGWYAKGTPRQRIVSLGGSGFLDSNIGELMKNFSTSSWDGTADTFPVYYIRDGQRLNCHFVKGKSRIFRTNGDRISGSSTTPSGDRIFFQMINFPWTGSV